MRERNVITRQAGLSETVSGRSGLSVFPNPTNDFLNLQLNLKQASEIKIEIYNSLGKIMFSSNQLTKTNKINERLSIQDLASGMYLLLVQSEQEQFSKKFTVNH